MQSSDWIPVVLALIAAVPGIFALRSQFAKDKIAATEAKTKDEEARISMSQKLIDQAMSMIEPLEKQIDSLEKQVERHQERLCAQDKRIRYLTAGVTKLITQIKEQGMVPVWEPQDEV